MSIVEDVDISNKQLQKIITHELKEYKALKIALENQKERAQAQEAFLFPRVSQRVQYADLKVRQVERALNQSLDHIEKQIIEQKFLSGKEINDIEIYLDLGIKKEKYYQKKKSAIYQLATALGII